MVLAWRWAHQRRDFVECAAAQENLAGWCKAWPGRIAAIYRLNKARLSHYEPAVEAQGEAYRCAQRRLETELDGLFAAVEAELAELEDTAREAGPLRSLLNHREGPGVFVQRPEVPMDNNFTERTLRGAAIGRKPGFGSDSKKGARLTAIMYSVVQTLALNGIECARLASRVARRLRGQRRAGPARSVAVAALVDGRGEETQPHAGAMSGPVECRYYGRDFTAKEMSMLRALIAETPPRNRFNLSKAFCRRIGWTKPDGGAEGHDGAGHDAGHAP